MAAKMVSFLAQSQEDLTLVEFEERRASSSNMRLREFLVMVAGAKQTEAFISQCRAAIFPHDDSGSLGLLMCGHNGETRQFVVVEKKTAASLRWEIRRRH